MTNGIEIKVPKYQSRMKFCGDYLNIDHPNKRPCWWFRIWHKVFFGITWEDLTKENDESNT